MPAPPDKPPPEAASRRFVLLEGDGGSPVERLLTLMEHPNVVGSQLTAELRRLAELYHPGRWLACEWFGPRGWTRYQWFRFTEATPCQHPPCPPTPPTAPT